MTGLELYRGRQKGGWTQAQAAERFGITQAYLSMMEKGHRPIPEDLAVKFARDLRLPPTALPLRSAEIRDFPSALGALGYPGFEYLRNTAQFNPAVLLLAALRQRDLEARVVESLPWLIFTYADMKWSWLLPRVKASDAQNRLGFIVALAIQKTTNASDRERWKRLTRVLNSLERSRLVAEGTLCRDSMTQAERQWLRTNRPAEAKHWNLLTDLRAEHIHA